MWTTVLVIGLSACAAAPVAPASSSSGSSPSTPTSQAPSGSSLSASPTSTDVRPGEPWIVTEGPIPGGSDGAYLVRADGSASHRILDGLDHDVELVHPDWSPDGARLVFGRGPGGPDSTGPTSIWTAAPDGSHAAQLATCDAPCQGIEIPAWSPDGRRVAFEQQQAHRGEIDLIDVSTKARRSVTGPSRVGTGYSWMRWSPDGTSLVVTIEKYDDARDVTASAIALIDVRTGRLRQLTPWALFATYPDWHPSRDLIVFSTYDLSAFQDTDHASNLFTVRPDGTRLTALTRFPPGGTRATQPTWTPDGTAIIFTLVTGANDENRTIAFSTPDGSRITDTGTFGTHSRLRPT